MIHMPHRSVTRFFVPLIDVLLLLFCIFLLMPFASEEEVEKKLDEAAATKDAMVGVQYELERRFDELRGVEKAREDLKNIQALTEELEKLRKLAKQPPIQRYNLVFIDINKDDGQISYVDAAGARKSIKSAKDAQDLIKYSKQEAQKNPESRHKSQFYIFLYPRPQAGYPVARQIRQYKDWFGDVATSLKE